MSNFATVFKDEIARVTRKEIRRETAALKKASATYRGEIAGLKRNVAELQRQLRTLQKNAPTPTVAANADSVSQGGRFSAKSMAAQRRRLGLSATDCAILIGATAQSIYNWEEGKVRPRPQHLPAIFALRDLGRRQASEIVEMRKAA